jgi:hypothetical protein
MQQLNAVDRYTTLAQILLSALYMLGLFVVVILYELGFARLTKEQEESFRVFVSFLTSGGLVILYFWFQRTRATGADSSPSTPSTQKE